MERRQYDLRSDWNVAKERSGVGVTREFFVGIYLGRRRDYAYVSVSMIEIAIAALEAFQIHVNARPPPIPNTAALVITLQPHGGNRLRWIASAQACASEARKQKRTLLAFAKGKEPE